MNTTTHLFCKQGVLGRKREVPPDGKISLHTGNGSTKAQALLLGSYNYSSDGPALEKSHEQPRGSWKNGPMGNKAE